MQITEFVKDNGEPFCLEEIIEKDVPKSFILNDKLLKRANIIDICHKDSKRSCCFTKAYTHYLEGTGSVYTDASKEVVTKHFEVANKHEVGSNEFIQSVKELNLRFFTPKEILALMSFPKTFTFPDNVTIKQRYRLLGNSINVKVVSELIKILFDE